MPVLRLSGERRICDDRGRGGGRRGRSRRTGAGDADGVQAGRPARVCSLIMRSMPRGSSMAEGRRRDRAADPALVGGRRTPSPFTRSGTDPEVMTYLGPAAQPRRRRDGHGAPERLSGGLWLLFLGRGAARGRRHDRLSAASSRGRKGRPCTSASRSAGRLRRDSWGQGFAREAAQASLDWGWANVDAAVTDGIWAMTVLGNSRSWGLMERLGMTRHPELDFDFDHPAFAPGRSAAGAHHLRRTQPVIWLRSSSRPSGWRCGAGCRAMSMPGWRISIRRK